MEFASDIVATFLVAATESEESGGSFLVQPGIGLMIWTVAAFLFTMAVLSKVAFPKIREAIEKRAAKISEDIEAAERQRKEADELLAEYRERLKEAREQAEDIVARARKAGETSKTEATDEGRRKRDELVESAKKDIEAETRRSLDEIRKEIADLTVLATEKVARKSLSAEDQERLVQEALGEVDFSALAGEPSKSGGGK